MKKYNCISTSFHYSKHLKGSVIPKGDVFLVENHWETKDRYKKEWKSLKEIKDENGNILWVAELTWAGFDDVGIEATCFQHKEQAEQQIKDFGTEKGKRFFEANTDVYILQRGEKARSIRGEDHEGYFCQFKAAGDILLPAFNKDFSSISDIPMTHFEKLANEDIRDILRRGNEKEIVCLMKVGEQGELNVVLEEDYNENIKKIIFKKFHCWETGIDYYQLKSRVKKERFSMLNLSYHSQEIEEEGNWKGWYSTDIESIKKSLSDWEITITNR